MSKGNVSWGFTFSFQCIMPLEMNYGLVVTNLQVWYDIKVFLRSVEGTVKKF